MRDYPKIITTPPGPKAKAIVDKDSKYTSTCYLKEYPLAIATGAGRWSRTWTGTSTSTSWPASP